MKSGSLFRLLVLGGMLPLFSPTAHSQDLTVFVGGTMPGDLGRDIGKINLENGPVWGFRLGFGFAAYLGLEATFAFSPDYLSRQEVLKFQDSNGFVSNANLIVQIPLGRIVPYGTFGLGLIHQYGSANLPVGTEFAINYGGGVKLPRLWGPFGLRIDGRGYSVPKILGTRLNLMELSGGLLISF